MSVPQLHVSFGSVRLFVHLIVIVIVVGVFFFMVFLGCLENLHSFLLSSFSFRWLTMTWSQVQVYH